MPTYEYECENSGNRFEVFQSMKDAPVETCPDCGGPARRLISPGAGVVFKGKGFYQTDYGGASSPRPSCGRSRPCCGRDKPCGPDPSAN
jgi:putative FmdB family regulatory protein